MAGLSSTAIVGFLTSGRLIKKRVNTEEGVEIVEDFKSGFSGSGWKIWKRLGKWTFETDNIIVRGVMTVFELLIQKIRGVKGALAITQASGKVKNVRVVEDFVYLEIEDEMYFVANDFVRCQDFSGTNQHFYHVEVAEIIGKEIVIPITEFALDDLYELIDPPVIGDEIVQFGNSRDKTRQSVIYLHADEGGQPAIDLMFDVDSKDWTGKVKVSVGGEIPNSNGQRGFYSVNGLIKSVNAEGQTIYEFSPNGAVNIGNGSIVYDPDTKRLIFGKDVVLTWDNLDEDTKENLKGEDGKDAIVYELMPDVQIIALSKDGSFKPSYVQCGVKKTVGNTESILSAEEIVSEGLGLFCVKDDSGFISINPADKVYPNDDLVNIVFYLRRDELILDSKTLPIIIEGKNGLSVFATYHDSEEEPARPTGEGIDNGWHTDQTAHVWWMSQKAATSASEGIWGEPIRIRGLNGKDANLLPWVQEYEDNKTLIGGEYVISPKMFSGTSRIDENKKQWLTGVAMGRDCLTEPDGTKRTGIFALVDNEVVFELDPILKKYVYRGTIYADAGEYAGTVKGVSGSFKSLNCENKDGKVIGGIELGDDGKMWFSGDMYHQGQDNVNKRGWIFYTAKLFCRDEFGHARMTSFVIDSNNATDFYVYLDEKPRLDAPANHIWSGVSGMPVDCLVLKGQGDYVIRICNVPKYKNLRVINETNYPKRVVFNHSLSATDEIGPYQFHNYVTGDSAFDFQSLTSITNLYKQYTP